MPQNQERLLVLVFVMSFLKLFLSGAGKGEQGIGNLGFVWKKIFGQYFLLL